MLVMRATLALWVGKVNRYRLAHPFIFWLRLAILAAAAIMFVSIRNFWTPDILFLGLLAIFLVFGQARAFIVRFLPFVALLLVYESFRGIADNLDDMVHYWPMIKFDQAVFGGLPTTWLQHQWWHGSLQWYDFYFYTLYTMHFVVPIVLAVVLWKLRPKLYWPFVAGLVGLSFMAFATYILFPAAPPWMAAENGFIAPIQHISSDIWWTVGIHNYSEVYSNLSPNTVAAVPSLHSAYPLLFILFLGRAFGWRRAWPAFVYPISIWLGVVYMGEHYVFDVLLGAAYAGIAYMGSLQFFAWRIRNPSQFKNQYQQGLNWGRNIVAERQNS